MILKKTKKKIIKILTILILFLIVGFGIYYYQDTKTDNKIKQIKALNGSKIIRQNQEIISDNMTYNIIDKKIDAFGNVTLTQDMNVINGDELKVDLLESTSIMKSNNQNRVKVKINKNNE